MSEEPSAVNNSSSSPPISPEAASHLAIIAALETIAESISKDKSTLESISNTVDSNDVWEQVSNFLKSIGDGLRKESLRIPLGQSVLPKLLTLFLSTILSQSVEAGAPALPVGSRASAAKEICRVSGNLCFDCDENRDQLLAFKFPLTLLHLLQTFLPASPHYPPKNLSLLRVSIGSLLNICLDHEPSQKSVLENAGLPVILGLSNALFLPGDWEAEDIEERAAIAEWGWKILNEVSLIDGISKHIEPTLLPLILPPILRFLPDGSSATSPLAVSPVGSETISTLKDEHPSLATRTALTSSSLNILQTCVQVVESFVMDEEEWQVALGTMSGVRASRSWVFASTPPSPFKRLPSPPAPESKESIQTSSVPVPILSIFLDIIEKSSIKEASASFVESAEGIATLGSAKGGIIKAVVAVAGNDLLNSELLKPTGPKEGGESWFVERMMSWLKMAKGDSTSTAHLKDKASTSTSTRDDLAICSVLSLGNLARNEQTCLSLISTLPSLLPYLTSTTDVKLQHGLVGFLKNLSLPDGNKAKLGDEEILQKVCVEMGVWTKERDMVGSVQGGAVGIAKHLCKGSVENSLRFVVPRSDIAPSPLSLLLPLIKRTDDVALRSESARILVNVIKSLSSSSASSPNILPDQLNDAKKIITTSEVINALCNLVRTSRKYLILVNEGVVALVLLCLFPGGAKLVAEGLATSHSTTTTSAEEPPTPSSSKVFVSALQALTSLLLEPSSVVQSQLKMNVLSLLSAMGKEADEALKSNVENALVQLRVKEGGDAAMMQVVGGILNDLQK